MHNLQYMSLLAEQKELYQRNHSAAGDALTYIIDERIKDAVAEGKPNDEVTRSAIFKDIASRIGRTEEQVSVYYIPF